MIDLKIHEHYPLREITTFRIGGTARYFIEIHSVNELLSALHFSRVSHLQFYIVGEGSNLFVSDRGFDGLILKMRLLGREIVEEDAQSVLVKSAAGESWDEFVAHTVNAGWWGIENLSFIPGSTGAFAVQNVGAYGQEASDVIEYIDAYDVETRSRERLVLEECKFSYRTSIFNSQIRARYIILNTFFRLQKYGRPVLEYSELQRALGGVQGAPTLQDIREAIGEIRWRKLPDIEELGSAGSFFKNFFLTPEEFRLVCTRLARHVGSKASKQVAERCKRVNANELTAIKLPTALLLDVCGLQGLRVGGAALYHKHPLIIVNETGNATASDVMKLVKHVRHRISRNTGLQIVPEPNLLGFTSEELREYFGVSA
ncbi:hypothetical protein CSA56_12910 [candidate division KSB3 bacterium]|uniref:UDP-N-acetylenolpyruvoylglucosamine reductase n=1 Tax=candidate division KSB3 bacterium TaxID=2044937 RepID=A0A2G6KBZ3_9BACT|nr:MAG: hypothetical protein CSA56_12910 [candidate division KSB3 bacterium]